jgi:hypothetical protein
MSEPQSYLLFIAWRSSIQAQTHEIVEAPLDCTRSLTLMKSQSALNVRNAGGLLMISIGSKCYQHEQTPGDRRKSRLRAYNRWIIDNLGASINRSAERSTTRASGYNNV